MRGINMDVTHLHNLLKTKAVEMDDPGNHLRELLAQPRRLESFSLLGGGLFLDFSRQRITHEVLKLLRELAQSLSLEQRFQAMTSGQRVNETENRAALHTATRYPAGATLMVEGDDVAAQMATIRSHIKRFSRQIHNGELVGSKGEPFRDIVVIGIGGSYLGTEFLARALEAFARPQMKLHFLSNVDGHNFAEITRAIDPGTTLWIVISKSFTTTETMANANLARQFMRSKGIPPEQHLVTVTSKGSPGDTKEGNLDVFHMFDFIGGRYSVTSAVGGVPLSLYLGHEVFEELLLGAHEMDLHAARSPMDKNVPLTAALITIWNRDFLNYTAQAIVPYAAPLSKLAAHIQQLNMESNGKSVSRKGILLDHPGGIIIFGEPGTNAQHSFFQMAHQGPAFPIDFIGVLNPQYREWDVTSKGVTNHQELWANLLAQPMALAMGQDNPNPAKCFSGNRPSSTLVLESLTPKNLGRLLAFYEAKTVYEAALWDINPFDQFGVELGKQLATRIRSTMAATNQGNPQPTKESHPIDRAYLKMLLAGKLSG